MLLTLKNLKTEKGQKLGYLTGILHLAPYTLSGTNLCPKATAGCSAACLNTAGHGIYPKVQQARLNRSHYFLQDPDKFVEELQRNVDTLLQRAERSNLKLAIRLNGTSDIVWERKHPGLLDYLAERGIRTYDYTKIENRRPPSRYHLTFSRSERTTDTDIHRIMGGGMNVAVVFKPPLPSTYLGYKVIDGDKHDLRFLDEQGVIVGLTAKGKARRDKSGFVVNAT